MKSKDEIQEMLDNTVNQLIKAHGGYVSVADVEEGVVNVNMSGGCQGCAAAKHTMSMIVSRAIKNFDPDVEHVFDVTDHDKGENPYFERDDGETEES